MAWIKVFWFVFWVNGRRVDVDAFAVGQAGPLFFDPVVELHDIRAKTLGLEMEDLGLVYLVRWVTVSRKRGWRGVLTFNA